MGPPGTRDETWFTRTYAAHYPSLVRYGLRRLGDEDTSAELAQEVFVVAWRRREEVPDHSLPWLYGVARRLLANHWRAKRVAPVALPLSEPDRLGIHCGANDASAALADVRIALAGLPDLDREILRLVGWEELTVGEAATVLGCTRTAAAVRLHRARRRLTAALAVNPTPPVVRRPAPAPALKDI
jgi:RNA polymerase sigma-70 factor (ECF subfamily)